MFIDVHRFSISHLPQFPTSHVPSPSENYHFPFPNSQSLFHISNIPFPASHFTFPMSHFPFPIADGAIEYIVCQRKIIGMGTNCKPDQITWAGYGGLGEGPRCTTNPGFSGQIGGGGVGYRQATVAHLGRGGGGVQGRWRCATRQRCATGAPDRQRCATKRGSIAHLGLSRRRVEMRNGFQTIAHIQ